MHSFAHMCNNKMNIDTHTHVYQSFVVRKSFDCRVLAQTELHQLYCLSNFVVAIVIVIHCFLASSLIVGSHIFLRGSFIRAVSAYKILSYIFHAKFCANAHKRTHTHTFTISNCTLEVLRVFTIVKPRQPTHARCGMYNQMQQQQHHNRKYAQRHAMFVANAMPVRTKFNYIRNYAVYLFNP